MGYHYDAAMQLDTLTDFAGGKTPFTYNGDGQEAQRTLPNGMLVMRDYPSTHLTSEITYLGTLDPKLTVGYQQESRGLVSARLNSARDTVTSYGYDRLARLTSISFDHVINSTSTSCSGGALQSPDGGVCTPVGGIKDNVWLDSYTWDAVGNPANHGATVATGNRLTQMYGYTLEYDDDGNLTHKYKTGFDEVLTWNSLGQLTQVVVNGTTVTYGYDAFGRRARRTKGTAYTQYLWDGDDVLFERDQAGTLSEYTSYPGIDAPHSLKRGSSIWYYATDNVGNVTGLIASPTTLADQYTYDPFGALMYAQETVANTRKFQGRELDPDAGLYYFRARWYDPTIDRFVSEDPIGLDGGLNMYAFVNNNPVNFTDPTGLCIELKDGQKPTKAQIALVKQNLDEWCTSLDGVVSASTPDMPKHCREPGTGCTDPAASNSDDGNSWARLIQSARSFVQEHRCAIAIGSAALSVASDVSFFKGALTAARLVASGVQLGEIAVRKAAEGATGAAIGYGNAAVSRYEQASLVRAGLAYGVWRGALVATGKATIGMTPPRSGFEIATRILPITGSIWAIHDAYTACRD